MECALGSFACVRILTPLKFRCQAHFPITCATQNPQPHAQHPAMMAHPRTPRRLLMLALHFTDSSTPKSCTRLLRGSTQTGRPSGSVARGRRAGVLSSSRAVPLRHGDARPTGCYSQGAYYRWRIRIIGMLREPLIGCAAECVERVVVYRHGDYCHAPGSFSSGPIAILRFCAAWSISALI